LGVPFKVTQHLNWGRNIAALGVPFKVTFADLGVPFKVMFTALGVPLTVCFKVLADVSLSFFDFSFGVFFGVWFFNVVTSVQGSS